MAEKDGKEVKERNIKQVVQYLSTTFNKATNGMNRPSRDKSGKATTLYFLQTEFAYAINEIMMCAPCMQQKHITDCNNIIDDVLAHADEIIRQEQANQSSTV